jgi:hypothetical protein
MIDVECCIELAHKHAALQDQNRLAENESQTLNAFTKRTEPMTLSAMNSELPSVLTSGCRHARSHMNNACTYDVFKRISNLLFCGVGHAVLVFCVCEQDRSM